MYLRNLVLFLWLFSATPPVFAASGLDRFELEDLRDNINADYIFVCSDFERLNSSNIKKFLKVAFPEAQHPIVLDGFRAPATKTNMNVLLFAAGKTPSPSSLSCLNEFSFLRDDLLGIVLADAEKLDRPPEEAEYLPLGQYYGPVKASFAYRRVEGWLFILFLSTESEVYRVNHALTNLFGLDISFCNSNAACNSIQIPQDSEVNNGR